MEFTPWLFHLTAADSTVDVSAVARELFDIGGMVIADPAHLPADMVPLLVSADISGDAMRATVHAIDWTVELGWDSSEAAHTAGTLYCLINSPGDMFDSVESLPEGTPSRVIAWLDLDDEGDE